MKWILKRRTFGLGAPNPYARGGRAMRRGKWETVATASSYQEALSSRSHIGLYEWAIFYGGKRYEPPTRTSF